MIILLTELATTYLRDTSAIMLWERDDYNCRKWVRISFRYTHKHNWGSSLIYSYWWRNLLFIQNLYTGQEICLNWSWTIACEMQFYVFATILYIIYCKNRRRGKMCFWITVGLMSITSTYYLIKHKFGFTYEVCIALALMPAFTPLDPWWVNTYRRTKNRFLGHN